jgi:sulfite oxidase
MLRSRAALQRALRAAAAASAPAHAPPSAAASSAAGGGGPTAAAAARPARFAAGLAAAAAALGVGLAAQRLGADAPSSSAARCSGPPPLPDTSKLPVFTREEVAKHRTLADRVWVTYRDGVYDVTDFLEQHPGGAARLMLAAGGAIDPFWAMYAQHGTAPVRALLEEHRVGRLAGGASAAPAGSDPYGNEPKDRHPALEVRAARPFNAETPRAALAAALVTPTELFYVRNHLPVPEVDPKTYRLRVGGEGAAELELSLEDLKRRFKKRRVVATLQCTGNRREDLNKTGRHVRGLEWEGGAIGTAEWAGASLADVLAAAGVDPADPAVRHVVFEGLDAEPGGGGAYGASIPAARALSPAADVLLAYEMNGAPLSRDHGAPLRALVPGVAGCRSVKWLASVATSSEESRSFWQTSDYKSFSPSVDWDNVDWASAPAIQNMPVTAGITEPAPGAVVEAGEEVTVRGYAWSGGGNGVIRVDVTADGGATWATARLTRVGGEAPGRAWAWALWEATVAVPVSGAAGMEVAAKATDESYNTQPERAATVWNLRGCACNAWPRVALRVAAAEP